MGGDSDRDRDCETNSDCDTDCHRDSDLDSDGAIGSYGFGQVPSRHALALGWRSWNTSGRGLDENGNYVLQELEQE